mmetsp:Transcript_125768/g.402556  ORF Transcript_125768/g.402556 Transcript_125768/m.402556 type:complete len:566 (-) Transcript_125768:217-1914(-)
MGNGCQACTGPGRPPGEAEATGDDAAKPQHDDAGIGSSSGAELGAKASLQSFASASSGSIAESVICSLRHPQRQWVVPPDSNLTVMMFGMTGAGKSSLGNLIAGSDVFEAADDTASVTNLDSVMRYEAADGSIVLMDTIGLGDTEIDQDQVVSSIRDVALSAPLGIDVLLFVMRNARITDDAIARLIYVTEYLWGQECLLNLYIVVTFANRYLVRKDEALQWIERQAEINWRFKHIYNLVGNNPNRFVFVDNPDPLCEEPGVAERQAASRNIMLKTLAQHPKDVILPFSNNFMKSAQKLTQKEVDELMSSQKEIRELGKDESSTTSSREDQLEVSGLDKKTEAEGRRKIEDLRQRREDARRRKKQAGQALKRRLEEVKQTPAFQRQAVQEADKATARFASAYERAPDPVPGKLVASGSPVVACKRMISTLARNMGRRLTSYKQNSLKPDAPPSPKRGPAAAPKEELLEADESVHSLEVSERALDLLISKYRSFLRGSVRENFDRLVGSRPSASLSPIAFQMFVSEVDPTINQFQAGGLWRRGDANCDGQMDLSEFAMLFGGKLDY